MGFLYQLPAIVGGTVLVIERIESQNYQPGLFGWSIYANGDAEFNNVTIRGTLVTGPAGSLHIEINGASAPNGIAFFTGDPAETFPGIIHPRVLGGGLAIEFVAPQTAADPGGTSLFLLSDNVSALNSVAHLSSAGDLELSASSTAGLSVGSNGFFVDSFSHTFVNDTLVKLYDPSLTGNRGVAVTGGYMQPLDLNAWIGTGTTPLVNAWVDVAGARFGYTKDATGRVQLRGEVISGTATQITTLPVGYRPSQSMEWIMRAQGGVVLCAVFVSTTGAVSVTANVASAQSGGVRLDSISYPTL